MELRQIKLNQEKPNGCNDDVIGNTFTGGNGLE